jgi:hypothetical protein
MAENMKEKIFVRSGISSHYFHRLYTVQKQEKFGAENRNVIRICKLLRRPEPVFVDLLRGPGIDSQPGGPVRNPICRTGPPCYIGWRNRFLGIDAWAP